MRSLLGRVFEHTVPLVVVCFLMAGSAVAASLITGAQIKDGSITGKDIKDGSLSSKDFKGSVKGQAGPAGKDGAPGKDGVPGQPGSPGVGTDTEVVQDSTAYSTSASKELMVTCPNGPLLTGGYVMNANVGDSAELTAVRSYAITKNSWLVRGLDKSASVSWQLTVVVVCAK